MVGRKSTCHPETFSANELLPGVYTLRVQVNDAISGQTVEPETTFAGE